MRGLVYLIIFIVLLYSASAATIQGTVYDIGLDRLPNAIVSINSTPKQVAVAKEGDYSFELPAGKYKIEARYIVNNEVKSLGSELIDVRSEGDFRLDLILLPNFEEEEELLNETEMQIEDIEEADYSLYVQISILIVAFVFVVFFIFKSRKLMKKQVPDAFEDADAKNIINFIKKQGGRITQKDIRKEFPSSEAKISLILTELEEKGAIKKIKRGRGNLIFLK